MLPTSIYLDEAMGMQDVHGFFGKGVKEVSLPITVLENMAVEPTRGRVIILSKEVRYVLPAVVVTLRVNTRR